MTTIYFIRHAEADNSVRDGRIRPLTEKGKRDRALVTSFLSDKNIEAVLSSPFKRAIDTVAPFAEKYGFEIETVEDFRERKSDSDWIRETDFFPFIARQWADFSYSLSDGECLKEVQERNISALNRVLSRHEGKNIVIGTHGTALSTIINYYDNTYGFAEFMTMIYLTPWAVKMTFDGNKCVEIEKIDLFNMSSPFNSAPLCGGRELICDSVDFWQALDMLVAESEIVIDRPKGSRHPKYPDCVYPLDYGYLKNTSSMDGNGIDVWRGTGGDKIDAIICTVDLLKRDSEIKILVGCTEEEKRLAIPDYENMKGILIRRETGGSTA